MASIPRYDAPQVAPQGLPGVRISDGPARDIAAAGRSLAGGLDAFGDLTGRLASAEQDKANRAAQLEVENQLATLETETLHAPETGFLNKQGKDAIGINEQFSPLWERRQSEIVAKAPQQIRQWAQEQADRRRQGAQRVLMRHSVQEGERHYTQQAKNLIANAANTATLNYLDPARVDEEAARAMLGAEQLSDLDGADDDTRGIRRAAAASGVYSAVLERKIATNPSEAAAYLEQVRGRLTGDDVTRMESVLRPVLADADAGEWIDAQLSGRTAKAGAVPVPGAAGSIREAEQVARDSVGRTLGLESGGRADAKNPRSSATGAGQFIDRTWLDIIGRTRPDLVAGKSRAEILAMRTDPAISREMTEAYAVENARGLYESGLPVTPQTVYLAHHFGIGGARAMLRADADTPVAQILPARDVAANPYLKGKTVAEVVANHQQRAGESQVGEVQKTGPTPVVSVPARTSDGRPDWIEIERRAQDIPNPLLRERAISRARAGAALEQRQEREAEEARDERVTAAINANPNAPLARSLSPQDYAAVVSSGKLPALDNYRESMARGRLVQDDFALVDEIELEAKLDPQAFLQRNIVSMADRLSTPTLTRLRKMQADGRSDPSKVQDWATEAQRLDGIFRAVGVGDEADARGKGSEAKNAGRARHRGELRIAWQMAVEAYTRETGKKPTGDAADKLARSVARSYVDKRESDNTSRFERNDQRREDGKPLIYEGIEPLRQKFSEEDRNRVSQAYRAKYGENPPDWWVDSYLFRKLQAGTK